MELIIMIKPRRCIQMLTVRFQKHTARLKSLCITRGRIAGSSSKRRYMMSHLM
ncbi:hypothetical protein M8C21_006673 [Ambrosia artemisiifolia]|uniref:Uncharacterized protein n=1 Tax=Ambrosia artemisiifolia TaxID=4212 RepID=A0AAD5D5H6_AMBAR|nr:hypothetical protein M8C21_006673 [Ambrosia artemisiifolia]